MAGSRKPRSQTNLRVYAHSSGNSLGSYVVTIYDQATHWTAEQAETIAAMLSGMLAATSQLAPIVPAPPKKRSKRRGK
jgi:hypothetical protein